MNDDSITDYDLNMESPTDSTIEALSRINWNVKSTQKSYEFCTTPKRTCANCNCKSCKVSNSNERQRAKLYSGSASKLRGDRSLFRKAHKANLLVRKLIFQHHTVILAPEASFCNNCFQLALTESEDDDILDVTS
eukprot:482773_1